MKNTGRCKVLVVKLQYMRLFGVPECRCEYDIQMDPEKWNVKVGTGFSWLRTGSMVFFFK
jgi:hypothetical protein